MIDESDLLSPTRVLLHTRQNVIYARGRSKEGSLNLQGLLSIDEDAGALKPAQATFNLINIIVGVGVLSVPYAFKESGCITLPLILLVIIITDTTGRWIGHALQQASLRPDDLTPLKARDFAYLADLAFGRHGQRFINTVTVLEVWFACVTFLVMNGRNAQIIWPSVSPVLSVPVTGAMATLLCLVPEEIFSYLSLLSTMSLLLGSVAIVASTCLIPRWARSYEHLEAVSSDQLWSIPQTIGIIVFCFAGHPCFPSVYSSMKQPGKWWNASVDVSFVIAFFFYGSLGYMSYMVFGTNVDPTVTDNLTEIKGYEALACRDIAAFCFLMKVQLTAPLLLNAIMVALWPRSHGDEGSWPPLRVLLLAAVGAATALAAVAMREAVAVVASLTGSAFIMTTSVLFPAAVHLALLLPGAKAGSKVCWRWALSCAPDCAILAFGLVMACMGTANAVRGLLGTAGT